MASLHAVVEACLRANRRRQDDDSAPAQSATRLSRACSTAIFICSLLLSPSANAGILDCIGLAPDGRAKCTAPRVSGYTYQLCRSSDLFVEITHADQCYAGIGGYGVPITSEGTLRSLISCMTGVGGPAWMTSGSANNHFCGGTVTNKYGTQVVGISALIGYNWGWLQPRRFKRAVCPEGYSAVGPDPNLPDYCVLPPRYVCEATPNPLGIANGDHGLTETDIEATPASPMELKRYYSSSGYYRPANAVNPQTVLFPAIAELNLEWGLMPGFGDYWRHTYDRRVVQEASPHLLATVLRHDGTSKHFRLDGKSAINEDGRGDTLTAMRDAQGNITGWAYTSDEAVEHYAATGELWSITTRSGRTVSMVYGSNGLLTEVTEDTGRYLRFAYDDKYRLVSVTDSAGNVFGYGYSGDYMLASVSYPGTGSRGYLYNENPLGRNGGPYGLTGVVDELGNRVATYGYASAAGPAYTEHAGATARHERTVVSGTQVSMSDPLGTSRTHSLQQVAGVPRIASRSQPAGAGCAASASNRTFDGTGNVASSDDFDGRRACMSSDPIRLLETTRVEGLSNTVACSTVVPTGSSLPAGGRKVSTQWHPDWRLETRRAEPGRITTHVYNGQPDPTFGNAIANCAPSNALLPDGKPIAVLCAKVEQATLDANGSQGLTASLNGSVAARRWSYTYDARGRMLTSKDPRNHTTTYAHYASTTADYIQGDLQSVTNPMGHLTQYTRYDKLGRLLRVVEPNGLVTDTAYAPRGWVSSLTVTPTGGGPQVTSYMHDLAGQVLQVSMPDGTTLTYAYDAAHRLTGVTDGAGNTITYILDDAGNRTSEQHKDPGGVLARSIARAYDALNRLQFVSGAAQ